MKVIIVGGATGGDSSTTRRLRSLVCIGIALVLLAADARAQEQPMANDSKPEASSHNDAVQANNPLANFTAFNVHNYYIGELTDPDKEANQAWLRYAQPFSLGETDWLMRASLPINTYPVPDYETGLGDFNAFAAYLFDMGDRKLSVGLGPQITAPTATENLLGSEKWSAGLVHTLFDYASPKFQYGYLLSWQQSFAGTSSRSDVNVGALQPFLFYQLGGGTYLRSSAVMSANFENGDYSLPLGLGVGQVIPAKKVVFNLFAEPQLSVADEGAGWPKWQIFVGLNSQFR